MNAIQLLSQTYLFCILQTRSCSKPCTREPLRNWSTGTRSRRICLGFTRMNAGSGVCCGKSSEKCTLTR
uniref:Uncharacterized protein n=1 Tax=Anguilla anguilla TaxID=7936 RepID=A0A0E9RS15_ANGAN